ncbi:MAG: hypothetical protein D6806_00105 [Deltaproteobacteria bacterium]|nr:MAG: hypothetical protein D6806_00105 [Deltaproteobacteria bacterium]
MNAQVRKKLVTLLCLSASVGLLAAASATTKPELMVLALLAASAPFAGKVLPTRTAKPAADGPRIERLHSVGLGQGHHLHLVKVGTESFLLACGPGQATLVAKLAEDTELQPQGERP